jgi:hypothetical protein
MFQVNKLTLFERVLGADYYLNLLPWASVSDSFDVQRQHHLYIYKEISSRPRQYGQRHNTPNNRTDLLFLNNKIMDKW